jgi:hypothetical protein
MYGSRFATTMSFVAPSRSLATASSRAFVHPIVRPPRSDYSSMGDVPADTDDQSDVLGTTVAMDHWQRAYQNRLNGP